MFSSFSTATFHKHVHALTLVSMCCIHVYLGFLTSVCVQFSAQRVLRKSSPQVHTRRQMFSWSVLTISFGLTKMSGPVVQGRLHLCPHRESFDVCNPQGKNRGKKYVAHLFLRIWVRLVPPLTHRHLMITSCAMSSRSSITSASRNYGGVYPRATPLGQPVQENTS